MNYFAVLQDEWNEVYIGDVKFTVLMPCGRYFNYVFCIVLYRIMFYRIIANHWLIIVGS